MDAFPVIELLSTKVNNIIARIKMNLKPNNKINLTVNICGPVILVPQKSSSPNVVAIDTGKTLCLL